MSGGQRKWVESIACGRWRSVGAARFAAAVQVLAKACLDRDSASLSGVAHAAAGVVERTEAGHDIARQENLALVPGHTRWREQLQNAHVRGMQCLDVRVSEDVDKLVPENDHLDGSERVVVERRGH